MAKFEPGHLHIERHALNKDDYSYNLCIDYELAQDPREGKGMQFTLHGSIEEKPVKESFFLAKDQAFDFARHATRIAQQYGLPKNASIASMHKYYDEMFEDVRAQLHVKSGDPMKPEHLE
ncbi:DUF5064 domain-containing protein [Pseudomonas gingeri NCPPB 3146 = LMG 5327]|uniref:DUF5064 family protein n=2 Tax=Pseudomonas gingeri TaxID=117681 RepID=A0A7Y7Y0L2_9PSED|nr:MULTISPECIES: DUF5064 family protein [Pseudomonas]NVZ27469.1 DUF5064 family protein [Pseudomonas gingeri]NWC14903.1 DUF5064 family protein [Pseudomonas gingeri]NWE49422.1 DUF5064 family protein [Pseudomonas gingeri]PNQ91742.1 DUF5064 domain-containing protein [Pseudomonas gingeri NCPPB 3146 = LMG 5327]BBP75218.1 DUF5064 domain-containing protein [Pseudomonas sp. Ost2]